MSGGIVSSWLYEKRPLKKAKLGPPDVYPQDPKQKEDELTAVNVKQGFNNSSLITDEYGSARNANIAPNRFGSYFSSLLAKKLELNTLPEYTRKKQNVFNKDNMWIVTAKHKPAIDAWFKDLASGAKTLSQLTRRVPFYNKKEEILSNLYEFKVPMMKAEWFLKVSSAYNIAMAESNNKSKKRQLPDPSQEWTNALCKFLRDQYQKLCESLHGVSPSSAAPVNSCVNSSISSDEVSKQWQYYTQLARHLFEGGLLDKEDFLFWLLELLEKIKSADDSVMAVVVPLVLQYVDEFTQSERLSRKLVYQCAKKLSQLVSDYSCGQLGDSSGDSNKDEVNKEVKNMTNNGLNAAVNGVSPTVSPQKDSTPNSANTSMNSTTNASNQNSSAQIVACFNELVNCSHHRNVILGLSVMIQIVTLDCPTALIWLNVGDSKASATLQGSPLDFLPCEPSNLPMPPRPHNPYLRNELRKAEEQIRERSKMSEMHWFCDRWQQTPGATVNKLLGVLDSLDKQCFDKLESTNSLDTLYSKIFATNSPNQSTSATNSAKDSTNGEESVAQNTSDILVEDEPTVRLLCEWAVTTKRTGEHRALVVAKLLEKRQSELTAEKDTEMSEESESTAEPNANTNPTMNGNLNGISALSSPAKDTTNGTKSSDSSMSTPIYQNLLLNFLDTQAPVYEDKIGLNSADNKQAFSNLILLFGELIRCDVFSHDLYMCTLISRGQFSNSPNTSMLPNSVNPSKPSSEEPSLAGFVPNLSTSDATNHNHLGGGPMTNGLQKSQSSSSLPMFDPLSTDNNINSQTNWESMDMGDDNVDADLDKLLQHIKAGHQNMTDQTDILLPDSVGSDKEDDHNPTGGLSSAATFPMPEIPVKNATNRHLLYTMHFPLPQDETFAHDCNQRHILLYGVGKAKDEAKHAVKKITKEITKLFNRKSSMDISDGAKVKKHAIKEGFNFESAITKFQALSTFDQHVVTTSCATAAVEMLNGVAIGNANYLPLIESIAFLFDLMEMALNVHGLIEFVMQMLKELVEVDIQLNQKCPILARAYCTSIGLYIVGVLYRYQTCLLVSHEETVAMFEGLWKLVRHVTNPSDCSSAERCILFYLWDLHSSYSYLRTKYHDSVSFNAMLSKMKQMSSAQGNLHSDEKPNMRLNNTVMMDYLKNPKLKVDPIHIRNINDNLNDRYSFVCNAIQSISNASDSDKLNEMSVLCAELTASCSHLSNEWLSALKALCCSSNPKSYSDLLTHVEISDLSSHDNIAVFTSILIARRCFSLKDFILQVAVPSLLAPSSGDGTEDAEPGARLTCHLLLCLFKTSETPLSSNTMTSFATSSRYSLTSPGPLVLAQTPPNPPNQRPHYGIKYPCDRYLLAAAHSTLRIEIVLTVLKAILVLGNSAEKKNTETKVKTEGKGELSIQDILGPMPGPSDEDLNLDLPFSSIASKTGIMEKAGLSDAAKYALRQICGQHWVHDRCLRGFMLDPDILTKLLLDPKLSHKEAQHLLNMICHPKLIAMHSLPDMDTDQKSSIAKILQNLDEWSIRVSWLQLQLMYCQSQSDVNSWLDNVAKATVDYFQNSAEEMSKNPQNSSQLTLFNVNSSSKQTFYKQPNSLNDTSVQKDRVWLIAPLISMLPPTVQGKILKVAANVLEAGNWMANSANQSQGSYSGSKNKDRGFQQQKNSSSNSSQPSFSLLSYPPFLSLVLMCLKGQDEQRECLLNSLYSQLSQAINEKLCEDLKAKHAIQEGLQLRLSLVGGMFDMIQKSTSLINEWSMLLLQLISFTIVDPQINFEIFTTVLDMLTVLITTTQVTDSSEPREETKKQYQNLIKKLKKELNVERITPGIKMVRQLLPIVKQQSEVITCEPMGSLIDTKGNKIQGFDSIDKKQGLQVAEKQMVSPWDLVEGHKNSSPLSWKWFGAVRMERKPIRAEENCILLARHKHSFRQPLSYYLEPPPLPPEDVIEQIPTPSVPPTPTEHIPMSHPLQQQMIPNQMNHMNTNQMIPNQMLPNPMAMDDPMRRETMLDLPLRAPTPKKARAQRKKRQPKNANGPLSGQQTPPIRMPGAYGEPYGTPQPHQQQVAPNWYASQPPQQTQPVPPPMVSQQQYYPPQQQMVGGRGFAEARPVGHSKGATALRNMLSTRHQSQQQFNMQNANPANQGMMGSSVAPQPVYQGRQQVMAMRQQMRGPAPQMQVNAQQNQMYSMQNQTVNQSQAMHHMSVPQQSSYGAPPNMAFANQMPTQMSNQMSNQMTNQMSNQMPNQMSNQMPNQMTNQMSNQMSGQMSMQNMDQTVQMSGPPSGQPPPGYGQHPSHNPMMMRAQMQSQSQMVGQQPSQQFMAQRSQYPMGSAPNVTMGQMAGMDSRPNTFQPNANMQTMAGTGGPHMTQWQTTGQRPQQPMVSQLQRQLSGGNQQQHNPYHQNQY